MGIFMFITFASANLITIGAMWYGLMSQYRYNNGMVLGVHMPPEHAEEPGVTEQVTNAKRKMKRFHIINLILIMALSILCFFNTALYVVIWIVWIFAYIGAAIYFNAKTHRKLYDYKVAQACRGTEKESLYRHGGTDDDGKKRSAVPVSCSRNFNRNPVRTAVFVWKTSGFLGRNGDILYLCRGGIGNGVDSAWFYQPQPAYGLQSGYAEKPAGQLPDKKIYRGSTPCHEQL